MCKKMTFILLVSCFLAGCMTSPTGRSQFILMPDAQVNQMGLQAFDTLKKEKKISTNSQYNQMAQCISEAIVSDQPGKWEVVVFEDKSLNAFALPGNKIGIYTGMLELVDNQDQLAAVIGHEVGHVLAKHSNERASQEMAVSQGMAIIQAIGSPQTTLGQTGLGLLGIGAEYGILMPYSRIQESEADIIGVELMAKAGFDPRQSVLLWQKMEHASSGQEPVEFLSTHPAHATRIQDLEQQMSQSMSLYEHAKTLGKQPRCK
jgi:predicted Zn-dependent protease